MSSSQLTFTPSFFRGVGGSTTNQINIYISISPFMAIEIVDLPIESGDVA